MSSDRLINILAAVTLIELMLAIGVSSAVADVWSAARDWRATLRAAAANYVLVPAAAVALLLLFRAPPLVAAGAIIVATCPGAPYGPPFTALAKGEVSRAVGLMVILAGSSAVVAPGLLHLLLPLVTSGQAAHVGSGRIVGMLLVIQFLPLCLGLTIAARRPGVATRLRKPLGQLSTILNVSLIGYILAVQFPLLAGIRPTGYVGMVALTAAGAVAGWILGGRDAATRKTFVITTSVRNVGVGLVIAAGSFRGTPAVTFTTAYGLVQTVIVALAALAIGRSAATAVPPLPVHRSAET